MSIGLDYMDRLSRQQERLNAQRKRIRAQKTGTTVKTESEMGSENKDVKKIWLV